MGVKVPIADYSGQRQEIASSDTIPAANLPVFVASGGSHAAGAVPDPGSSSGTTKFLREDATWQVPAGGGGGSTYYSWNEVTGATQSASVNNAYIANNASQVVVTLPSTAAVGDKVLVMGKGAGGWKLAQNASQQINFNGTNTTNGTGGYLKSNVLNDFVEVICTTANTTWEVLNFSASVTADTALSITGSLIDVGGVLTIIDDDVADTLISATAKPGSPQYTRTILSGDIPVNANVTDYKVYISIGGKNTDSSTRTINWRMTLNGAEIGSADTGINPSTANPFWYMIGIACANGIQAGDVIGVKLWGSVTNVIDYRYVTIYITPRLYNIPGPGKMAMTKLSSPYTYSSVVSGAVSGVTYITISGVNTNFYAYDPGVLSTSTGISPNNTTDQHVAFYPQQFLHIWQAATFSNNNNFFSNIAPVAELASFAVAFFPRYFRVLG